MSSLFLLLPVRGLIQGITCSHLAGMWRGGSGDQTADSVVSRSHTLSPDWATGGPSCFFFLSTKRHSPAVSLCRRKHACTHVWEASYLSLQILQLSQGAGACRWWVNACFLLWCNWRVYSGGNKNVDFRLSSSDLICFSCTLNTTSTVPLTSIIFERKHISPNHISHPKQSTKRTGDKITTTE